MTAEYIDRVFREIKNLKYMDHPNILKMYEYYEDDAYYYIIMDIFRGGMLFDQLIAKRKVYEKDAALLLKQLLSALSYCH